mmetsp:Transcript_71228/g.230618  ORF Transcript_71228/g.230618 Transcript_71228/m.230618 type:complete len:534 (-) Transcript_71228:857-2458(-)
MARSLKLDRSRLHSGQRCSEDTGKPAFLRNASKGPWSAGGLFETYWMLAPCSWAHCLYSSGMPWTASNSRRKVLWSTGWMPLKTSVTFTVSSMSEMTVSPSSGTRCASARAEAAAAPPPGRGSASRTSTATRPRSRSASSSSGSESQMLVDRVPWTSGRGNGRQLLARPPTRTSSLRGTRSLVLGAWRPRKIRRARSSKRSTARASKSLEPGIEWKSSCRQSPSRTVCLPSFRWKTWTSKGKAHPSRSRCALPLRKATARPSVVEALPPARPAVVGPSSAVLAAASVSRGQPLSRSEPSCPASRPNEASCSAMRSEPCSQSCCAAASSTSIMSCWPASSAWTPADGDVMFPGRPNKASAVARADRRVITMATAAKTSSDGTATASLASRLSTAAACASNACKPAEPMPASIFGVSLLATASSIAGSAFSVMRGEADKREATSCVPRPATIVKRAPAVMSVAFAPVTCSYLEMLVAVDCECRLPPRASSSPVRESSSSTAAASSGHGKLCELGRACAIALGSVPSSPEGRFAGR